jgi:hypothetical protein
MRVLFRLALLSLNLIALPALAQDFTGHYYLHGVTEVGSEMLLKPDGTFQWMLAYGAIDRSAHGHWHRSDNTLILDTDPARAQGKLFSLIKTLPWEPTAEASLQASLARAAEDEADRRCSFLHPSAPYVSDSSFRINDKRPQAELERQAHTWLTRQSAFLTAVEQTAGAAVAARHAAQEHPQDQALARQADATVKAAAQAYDAWLSANLSLQEAYAEAKLPQPKLAIPVLPAACSAPQQQPVDDNDPNSWHPGLAIRIHTRDSDEGRNGIPLTFVFANGERIQQRTDESGYAAIVRDNPASLRAVELARPEPNLPPEEIALDPSRGRVFYLQVDTDAIVDAPAFDHLVLQIKGSDLVSEKIGGGYSRQ